MRNTRILLTGATGAIGPHLIASLLRPDSVRQVTVLIRSSGIRGEDRLSILKSRMIQAGVAPDSLIRLKMIVGDVTDPASLEPVTELRNIDVVIHAAADTRFRAPPDIHEQINVLGTRNMLACATSLPRLRRFVHVSTICVAGTRTGVIDESISRETPDFLNSYEQSKWQSERLVADSALPSSIVRLSVVAGSSRDGVAFRLGALHQALRWFYRGLIPMIPGNESSRIDIISTECAADGITRAALNPSAPPVSHVCAGENAIPLADLIDCAVEQFGRLSPTWRKGQIARPMIVDDITFELFRQSVVQSGDVLFRSILESLASFLPGLLYPKIYETSQAKTLFGGLLPPSDCRSLLQKVITASISSAEPQPMAREVCHV
jgi:nucleoside-diphosphate-sugar epimerase